jgi:hypothetical protein
VLISFTPASIWQHLMDFRHEHQFAHLFHQFLIDYLLVTVSLISKAILGDTRLSSSKPSAYS